MPIEKLFDNKWISVKQVVDRNRGIGGYVFSHEASCDGKKIVVLPFRKVQGNYIEYGIRKEVTPCWGLDFKLSALTGSYEGGDPRKTAVMELKEEAGFDAVIDELIPLGTCFGSKSSDTIYYLYAIDVSFKKQGPALGDGSKMDAEGSIVFKQDPKSDDAQLGLTYLRLLKHLGKL